MARKRYVYDPESCEFVEDSPDRTTLLKRAVGIAVLLLLVAGGILWLISSTIGTPHEQALEARNERLSEQMSYTKDQLEVFSQRLDSLAKREQELYRTLLRAEPISEDIRQLGIGGSDAYVNLGGDTRAAGTLSQQTRHQVNRLAREINLQTSSYRELLGLAQKRGDFLNQLPAILPIEGTLVSGYGYRQHPIYNTVRMHEGVDFVARIGTPVYSTGSGTVTYAGVQAGFGKHVRIKHGDTGYYTIYAHLSSISDDIRRGVRVDRGEQIGKSGNTGVSAGPHLHYEVRRGEENAINPVYFFGPELTPEEYRELLARSKKKTISLD